RVGVILTTMRSILVGAVAAALAIGAYTALAPSTLPRLMALNEERSALEAELSSLRAENAKLSRDVERFQGTTKESKAALDRAIREELGYIGKDEILLVQPTR